MESLQQPRERILAAINECRRNLLLYSQAALPQSQFEAFRKLLLNELGKSGLEGKVIEVLDGRERAGSHELRTAKKVV